MAALAPDIGLLRNELIKTLRAQDPPMTMEDIGKLLGINRAGVSYIIARYNLDGRGTNRVLSPAEKRVIAVAKRYNVHHPVPIYHHGNTGG